ncbi:MarR family transcriptional regulator [Zoogloea sp.]|uniref:MarR family winged helix-turn-helix transcriptional regulator n=1 Tax=Zoogloea sp. TaxID=49181 RepID=UPI00261C9E4A|nr:MarR family transcriptional regulator [Zoogloea sp.]MDD3353583.1 MarR family transcriptional regulator [Zoogloea sp.]
MNTTRPLSALPAADETLSIAVLKQFRLIFGSVRQHFREVEQRCGISGSQLWLLHEIAHQPGIGVSELAIRLSIHQSTCSQLVDKLEGRRLVVKMRNPDDLRRVGLQLGEAAVPVLAEAPGPVEGILPQALHGLTDDSLQQLHMRLAEVIAQLGKRDDPSAGQPLADL